jgi:hypothetical protein
MTCIAGIAEEGRVYVMGDSAGVAGLDLTVRRDEKVFFNGPFLTGFTSSFREGQRLRYSLTVARQAAGGDEGGRDAHRYLSTLFVDAVRQCFKDGGCAGEEDGREKGGTFLLGYRGRLYRVGCDYQVGESRDDYDAVGCGENIALGALHATRGGDLTPRERLTLALRAAAHHSAGVRPPFLYGVL